ncbi:MAG: hypothetical protein NTY38_12785, partial [Acidobacteria bacterium]|nr:hypothetical protein [Acidobacteriota bacterium]
MSGGTLAAGSYPGSIRIQSGGSEVTVPVLVEVSELLTLAVAPAALSFRLSSPASDISPQVLSVLTSGNEPVTFQAEADGPLAIERGPGDRNITVSVVSAGLEAGSTVNGSVTVRASGTAPEEQRIPVEIRVDAPPEGEPIVRTAPEVLTVTLGQGGTPGTAAIGVTNSGGGAPEFRASATSPWLSVSPEQFTLTAPVALLVVADPSKIGDPGDYSTEIVIAALDGSRILRIPVVVTLTGAPNLLLSRTSLRFTAIQGGAAPPPQLVDIGIQGAGKASWMAQPVTESGEGWLSFGPGSGTSSQESSTPASVLVDAAQLEPGEYHGSVIVFAPGTANLRQTVYVALTVLPSDAALRPVVEPAGLILTQAPHSAELASRTVTVLAGAALSYASVAVTGDGGSWCGVEPATGTVDPGGSLTVQANFAGLAAGVHRCSIRVLFGDGTV